MHVSLLWGRFLTVTSSRRVGILIVFGSLSEIPIPAHGHTRDVHSFSDSLLNPDTADNFQLLPVIPS